MNFLKNNFVLKFTVTFFVICILMGILIYTNINFESKLYIDKFKEILDSTHSNIFLPNILEMILIFSSSIFFIGLPISYLILLYEGISIGFTTASFFSYGGLKGVQFYLIFILVIKLIHIVLLIYFTTISTRFVKGVLSSLLNKNYKSFYYSIIKQCYRFLLIMCFTLLNSIFIYFLANKILEHFLFLV